MSWTEITRREYRREGLRYASDLPDAEWELLRPLMPPASALGRPRQTDLRCVVEARQLRTKLRTRVIKALKSLPSAHVGLGQILSTHDG